MNKAAILRREGEEVSEWQPIETAPRDGTEIIVAWHDPRHSSVRGVSKAKWVTADFWADLEGGSPDDFEAGWYEPNAEDELCANLWMALPPVPDALPESPAKEQIGAVK